MQEKTYKNYLVAVLTLIAMSSFVERAALGLVLDNIKADLHLSDTQLGFLGGISFALFYSVMGVPIARWADRGDRVTIISWAAASWSMAVAFCAAATSFVQLLLIRVVVAVGEAGATPPAFSLIADNFTRAERPRASAIYGTAAPLSTVIGFFFAGWLNQLYGWRTTFLVLGLPGLVLAVLAWLTLKEPRRAKQQSNIGTAPAIQPTMKQVAGTLWANRTFLHLLLGFSIMCFFANGIFLWLPAFVMRTYNVTPAYTGMWLAGIWGVCGVAGAYLGGTLASRHAAGNERLQFRVLAAVIGGGGALSTFAYIAPSQYAAFALIGVSTLGLAASNGPIFAAIQTLVPEHMRAVSIALVYLVANLVGMGLGPLAAGALSDVFRVWVGDESLRYALLVLSPGYLVGGWHVWRASKTVTQDLAVVQPDRQSAARGMNVLEESANASRL